MLMLCLLLLPLHSPSHMGSAASHIGSAASHMGSAASYLAATWAVQTCSLYLCTKYLWLPGCVQRAFEHETYLSD